MTWSTGQSGDRILSSDTDYKTLTSMIQNHMDDDQFNLEAWGHTDVRCRAPQPPLPITY